MLKFITQFMKKNARPTLHGGGMRNEDCQKNNLKRKPKNFVKCLIKSPLI